MSSARPAAVGAFVLGGLAIVAAGILFFGGGNVFAPRTKAVVFFEGSVGGLVVGAPVTFRGVRVGSVSNVALVVDSTNLEARIPVNIEIETDKVTFVSDGAHHPRLPEIIEAGLRAKLVSQSFVTGQMLIELDLDPKSPAHFVGGPRLGVPEIPAIQSDLDELRQQLTHAPIAKTIARAGRAFDAIDKLATKIDGELDPLIAGALRVLDSADRNINLAGSSIQRIQQDASKTLDEIGALAHDGRGQLAARGDELSHALLGGGRTVQSIDRLATSANDLVAPRSQARTDLEATLRDLAAAASSLRDFARTIDHDPGAVLTGRASR